MKRMHWVVTIIAAGTLLFGGQAMATKSSVELGKELFGDSSLGGSVNDQNCNNCHADGKGLANAATNKKLVKLMNRCITGQLEGKKIDGRSAEMRSLKMYIKSLSGN